MLGSGGPESGKVVSFMQSVGRGRHLVTFFLVSFTATVWAAPGLDPSSPGAIPLSATGLKASASLLLFCDVDDEDDDGLSDRELLPSNPVSAEIRWLHATSPAEQHVLAIRGAAVRVLSGGRELKEGSSPAVLQPRIGLQGVAPGLAQLVRDSGSLELRVYELIAMDAEGRRVDLATSHASLSRTLPDSLRPREERIQHDGDALQWQLIGPDAGMPQEVSLVSLGSAGRPLDRLDRIPLSPATCPLHTPHELRCRGGPLIRATTDALDRQHPRALERSLRAEVGGRIVVYSGGLKAGSIRVGGPRQTRLGPLERYRGTLRVRVLRSGPGAGVAVGSDLAGGLEVARRELGVANALWGQCGIQFGDPSELDVQVVDPPPPHMFAVGCGLGLPAGGGTFMLSAAGRRFEVDAQPGSSPAQVAQRVAHQLGQAGLRAVLSPNPREDFAAYPSVDVLVRGAQGQYVPLDILRATVHPETDLAVCLGAVNLSDGLSHFTDADAAVGTLEERSLLKALADDDPSTIDVLLLPYFVTAGRVGESFVDATGLGVRNAVILDRAGVRAGARSFALAHELGHILLQLSGHPDDFGLDSPTSLMDADAADASVFGPRRLSVSDCERAILQSGPDAPLPLLRAWPLFTRRPMK
jgi:hypothetical protein